MRMNQRGPSCCPAVFLLVLATPTLGRDADRAPVKIRNVDGVLSIPAVPTAGSLGVLSVGQLDAGIAERFGQSAPVAGPAATPAPPMVQSPVPAAGFLDPKRTSGMPGTLVRVAAAVGQIQASGLQDAHAADDLFDGPRIEFADSVASHDRYWLTSALKNNPGQLVEALERLGVRADRMNKVFLHVKSIRPTLAAAQRHPAVHYAISVHDASEHPKVTVGSLRASVDLPDAELKLSRTSAGPSGHHSAETEPALSIRRYRFHYRGFEPPTPKEWREFEDAVRMIGARLLDASNTLPLIEGHAARIKELLASMPRWTGREMKLLSPSSVDPATELMAYLVSRNIADAHVRLHEETPPSVLSRPDRVSIQLPRFDVQDLGKIFDLLRDAAHQLPWLAGTVMEVSIKGGRTFRDSAPSAPSRALSRSEARNVLNRLGHAAITAYSPFIGASNESANWQVVQKIKASNPTMRHLLRNGWALRQYLGQFPGNDASSYYLRFGAAAGAMEDPPHPDDARPSNIDASLWKELEATPDQTKQTVIVIESPRLDFDTPSDRKQRLRHLREAYRQQARPIVSHLQAAGIPLERQRGELGFIRVPLNRNQAKDVAGLPSVSSLRQTMPVSYPAAGGLDPF